MGFFDNIWGSSSPSATNSTWGNVGAFGNILGGLGTAATIYGLYQQNKQAQDARNQSQTLNAEQLAENKREFDITAAQKDKALEQSAAAAGASAAAQEAAIAAQVQAAHSHAISGAYDSLINAVQNGRGSEVASLSGLIDRIQRAYAQR